MLFDVLVATRNRQSVLQVSLPLMLSQHPLPSTFIFIDSSDDHALLRKTVEQIFQDAAPDANLQIIKSASGLSHQRNVGLRHTKAPVVFFPDDDALWFKGMTAAVMRVYERDNREAIGAVCPVASPSPPPEAAEAVNYSPGPADMLRAYIGKTVNRFEKRFFMDPIYIEGYARCNGKHVPEWLPDEDAEVFGPMSGFQMSFRTDAIRRYGFDENLGNYSLFEDRDASLNVLKEQLIVCTKRGRVFHFRVPGARTNDYEWGIINMLNRAYVVCKHCPPGSAVRKKINSYSLYRLSFYLLKARSRPGRQRIKGAWKAISSFPALLTVPEHDLTDRFVQVRDECLRGPIR